MIREKKTGVEPKEEGKGGGSWLMSFLRAELIDPAWVFAHANYVLF